MTNTRIKDKIAAYFEATLSRNEEDDLFRQLLSLEGRDPTVDEALAVMLASRTTPAVTSVHKFTSLRLEAIAASIAVLSGICVGMIIDHFRSQPEMIAYVGGVRIDNSYEIKKIIETQLNDIEESSDLFSKTVATDFDDIREALTTDDL